MKALQRELVIDIYLEENIINKVEETPFLLNKLLNIQSKGANIYIANRLDPAGNVKCVVQQDFQKTMLISADDVFEEIERLPFDAFFTSISSEGKAYREDHEGVSISFSSESNTVFKGKSTTIRWEVKNAESIKIIGIGEVPAIGQREVQVLENTILILSAINKRQKKYKAIHLKAVRGIDINYDVQFLNPASKKYISLKNEENYEGVFGVSKGNKIKLVWEVLHADQVAISPFGLNKSTGEHIFVPNGTLEINIQAILQGKTTNKRIIIHEFPMPIFADKLIAVNGDFVSNIELNIKDFRGKAHHYIQEKGLYGFEAKGKELREKIKSQENELMERYSALNFSDFYRKHSLDKLNKSIIGRLKSFFKDKPKVIEMINLLHQHGNESEHSSS